MRIGLCGTQSVGKSTLVKALSQLPQFKDYHIGLEKSKQIMEMGIPLNTDSTYLGQQVFASHRAMELLQDNMITDRTIIDVIAFTNLAKHHSLSSFKKRQLMDAWLPMASYYDYIFYISPDGVEIENNGVRETNAEYRQQIDNEIRNILENEYIEHFPISGTTEKRIQQILAVTGL